MDPAADRRRAPVDAPVDPAVRKAREVVGLYGDPAITWGIAVDLRFREPLDLAGAPGALHALTADHPHLGRPPELVVAHGEWATAVSQVAVTWYGDRDPLVRVVVSEDGTRLVVGAHHGVCDGLGLLAVAEAATGAGITTAARGIGGRTSSRSFLLASAARVGEAVVAPPARFRGTAAAGSEEVLVRHDLPPLRAGTAVLAHAIGDVFAAWQSRGETSGRRPVLSFGASRREATLAPDRQTAYFRLPFDPHWSSEEMRSRVAALEPEPAFPETSAGGWGPRLTSALRKRLGATATISNLGRLGGVGLESAAMFPAASGPSSPAFGFATTSSASVLTLRARATEFAPAQCRQLLDQVAARLEGEGRRGSQ